MLNNIQPLGFSVYHASFDSQKNVLVQNSENQPYIFISLHIKEEFNDNYCKEMVHIFRQLTDMGYRVIADVSPNTIEQFAVFDIFQLAGQLSVYAFCLDFGFSDTEILEISKKMPIVLNASTVKSDLCLSAVKLGSHVMAMHNFYPRRETGLDNEYFEESTNKLKQLGVDILAFIHGDSLLRGPLFERLPTLEQHRQYPPSVGFIDLIKTYNMDSVFVGDPGISQNEQQRILRFQTENIIEVPVRLKNGYEAIYDRVFTCRIDSPKKIVRAEESRVVPVFEKPIQSDGGFSRCRGSITIDNELYGRYSGEIQLLKEDFPVDSRVNVIGNVLEEFIPLLDLISRGDKFSMVRY